jgi:hypothetical protein
MPIRKLLLVLFAICFLVSCSKTSTDLARSSSPTPTPKEPVREPTKTPTAPKATPSPVALSAAELERIIEDRYDDLSYTYMTRDIEGYLDIVSDPFTNEDGKQENTEQRKAEFLEDLRDRDMLEKEVGESLRFSLQNDIIKLTPKGPKKVDAFVKFTLRMRTKDGFFVDEVIAENTDVWQLEKDGTWRMCESKDFEIISATVTVDGKVENIPLSEFE